MSTLLTADSLHGGYGSAPVLSDIEIHVASDEIVAIFGANGAGKTSLLRALSGTLPQCRGRIQLDGRSLDGSAPWTRVRAGMALVPEGRHVFPALTVRANLDVASLVRRPRAKPDQMFELFPRLRERETQPAGSLSGGEQQMLVIARAMMTQPRLLMIDEMSAGLAPVLVDQLVDGLLKLRGTGLGILLVEQSPHLVARAVDRVYLLEQGRIVDSGSLDSLGGPARLAELYLGVR